MLTPNAILTVNSGKDLGLQPFLQVLDVRQIGIGHTVQERYRLLLSDGTFVQQAMLGTQLNELVKNCQVQKGAIVKLIEYVCNTVQNRKIIIVLGMDVVKHEGDIIGDPKQAILNEESLSAASQQKQPHDGVSTAHQQKEALDVVSQRGPCNLANSAHNVAGPGSQTPEVKSEPPVLYATVTPVGGGVMNAQTSPYARLNDAPARIVPITALNPYQSRWTIKARVTAKGDLHNFHNTRGSGRVFHFDLLDGDNGEIRVACFNSVADELYNRIHAGKVYLISKGSLKPVRRAFNHLKHDWEIFLASSSIVELCPEESDSIPQQCFHFKTISEVQNLQENALVDLMGIVRTIKPAVTILQKNGTEAQKCTLQLHDSSGCSVDVTLWGPFCEKEGQQLRGLCDSGHSPILAIKGGRVSQFMGKVVGTISSTQVLINPSIPQALGLKEWFEQVGKIGVPVSISKECASSISTSMRKTVSQIKDEGLGRGEKPVWITLKAIISYIKSESFHYTACPLFVGDRQCLKKVISNGDGTWRCDRCDKLVAECEYRYLLSLQIQDHTGVAWLTAFQEAGEELMGVSAKELYVMKQDGSLKYNNFFRKLLFSERVFKLKVGEENYNDELRVKSTLVESERLNYVVENNLLVELIGKLSRGEQVSQLGSPIAGTFSSGYSGYDSKSQVGPSYGTQMAPPRGAVWGTKMQMRPPGDVIWGRSTQMGPLEDPLRCRSTQMGSQEALVFRSQIGPQAGGLLGVNPQVAPSAYNGNVYPNSTFDTHYPSNVPAGFSSHNATCFQCAHYPNRTFGGYSNNATCFKCGGAHHAMECPKESG